MEEEIPLSRPYLNGNELLYLQQVISERKMSGDGPFTKRCHQFFQERFGFEKPLLTSSCTDALEMAALLSQISYGDEVILPSYTFPSTANAFLLRGARLVFADSCKDHPNMDVSILESLMTKRTKAIVVVHYAGVAVDMDPIMELATRYKLYVVEDAAHAIDSYYKGVPLGRIGHCGAFSFHESKNISSGEGGLLAINRRDLFLRAEIVREKGTNRTAFFRGEVAKYSWVDIGSSYLPSELIAAVLLAQLEQLDSIQKKRVAIWQEYEKGLKSLAERAYFDLPVIPDYATNNAHLFYILCRSEKERENLSAFLKQEKILTFFHYQPLHSSSFYSDKHDERKLLYAELFSQRLLRLPLYCDLPLSVVRRIIDRITLFFVPLQ